MNSKIALIFAALSLAVVGCGDFERGEPLPQAPADDAGEPGGDDQDGDNGETGGEAVPFTATHDALMSRCSSCHGATASNALALSGDPAADYATVSGLVNTGSPADSALLQKGAGISSHGGGPVLAPGAEPYETILAWIAAGAAQ